MDLTGLLADLRRHEGFVGHAYVDTRGLLTIGYGRLIDEQKGGGISVSEGEYLLRNDVQRVMSQVNEKLPWVKDLSDVRQNVLYNMAFQLGVNGLLGFKRTLAHIKAGRYAEAADELLNSKWASQTPNRATELSTRMRTNL